MLLKGTSNIVQKKTYMSCNFLLSKMVCCPERNYIALTRTLQTPVFKNYIHAACGWKVVHDYTACNSRGVGLPACQGTKILLGLHHRLYGTIIMG
jgi:hypothetical protein